MRYCLTGFSDDAHLRVFSFEGVGENRVRTEYEVSADLTLLRKYGIQVQELPRLCLSILEGREEADQERKYCCTEAAMSSFCAGARAARELVNLKRKSLKRTQDRSSEAAAATQH